MNIRRKHFLLVSVAGAMIISGISGSLSAVFLNSKNTAVEASSSTRYPITNPTEYYKSISENSTTLLSDLNKLNSSKKKADVGYKPALNDPGNGFYITDPGDTKGSTITTFYSGKSNNGTGGLNREHVWPDSRGGNLVQEDIHMPRPTLNAENGSRGNSFYVEGKCSQSGGWDPAMEDFGQESYRGDSARIIFYCAIANTQLTLVDKEDDNKSNKTMGKLSDLLKWNIKYPVQDREKVRNDGAESLQGNRNPFIDHPEYACKIWGNTNDQTRQICNGSSEYVAVTDVELNKHELSLNAGTTETLIATVSPNNASNKGLTWTSSKESVATVDSNGFVRAKSAGTTTITVKTNDGELTDSCTLTVTGVSATQIYKKVTSNLTDWTGEYLLIYEDSSGNKAWNGNDASGDSNVSISNSECEKPDAAASLTVAKMTNGYSIKVNSDTSSNNEKYISGTNGSNGVNFNSSPVANTISYISGSTKITSNTSVMRYNSQSSQFRYYKSSSYSNQQAVQLYKLEENVGPKVTSVTLDPKTLSFDLYQSTATKTITATVLGDSGVDTSVIWTSSKKSVATVVNGIVTPIGVGQATITATSTADSTKSDTCIVTVSDSTPKVTGLTLSPTSLTFDVYNNMNLQTIEATVTADTGADKTVTWSSSNEDVAIVNEEGVVTPQAKGSATITAKAGTITKTCSVTVNDSTPAAVSGVTLNKGSTTLVIGSSETLIATVNPPNAGNKNVTWSTNNPSIATVSNGTVNAIGAGTATITVATEEGGFTDSCTVTVTAAPVITYQLEADQETVPYMSGTNHQVSVGVKLYKYTNGVKGSQVASSSGYVDTSILGPTAISYTHESVVYETSVKVTNEGADVGLSSQSEPVFEDTSASFTIQSKTTNSWSMPSGWLVTSSGTIGYEDSRGYQLQTGANISFRIPSYNNIKSISIDVAKSNNGKGSFNISIGGTEVKSISSFNTTKTTETINFNPTRSGTIEIEGNATTRSIYIKNIKINYQIAKEGQIIEHNATPTQQATAWSNYFIKLTGGGEFDGPCKLGTPEAKKAALQQVWGELKSEYVYMVEGSKTAFCSTDATETIAEAVQHYRYIVNTYGLEDFAEVPQVSSSNRLIPISDSEPFIIGIIAMVGLAAIGACFVYKRRRE